MPGPPRCLPRAAQWPGWHGSWHPLSRRLRSPSAALGDGQSSPLLLCAAPSSPSPGLATRSASVAPVLKGVEILQPCSLAQRSLPCAGQDRRVLVACQAPLSVEFSRQEYWTGLPFPAPGDFPDSGIEPPSLASLALAGRFFTATWEAPYVYKLSSVAQSCLTLRDPMNRSTPDLPVHHKLPEFTQTHAHRVGDAIQPSYPLSSPSPPAPNPSQHQGLFQ